MAGRKSEFVYFVQADLIGLIKIGIASNMAQRLSTLQCGSPDKLTLLGVVPHSDADRFEGELHSRFARDRQHGEWFRPGEDLLAFVSKHAMSTIDYQRYRARITMNDLIARGIVVLPPSTTNTQARRMSRKDKLARYKAARVIRDEPAIDDATAT